MCKLTSFMPQVFSMATGCASLLHKHVKLFHTNKNSLPVDNGSVLCHICVVFCCLITSLESPISVSGNTKVVDLNLVLRGSSAHLIVAEATVVVVVV